MKIPEGLASRLTIDADNRITSIAHEPTTCSCGLHLPQAQRTRIKFVETPTDYYKETCAHCNKCRIFGCEVWYENARQLQSAIRSKLAANNKPLGRPKKQ